MKVYEIYIGEDDGTGVDAIAFVERPAIESDFIAMSAQGKDQMKLAFKTVNEEKRIVTGLIMIPDKMIYRRDKNTGEEYYAYFSKETVEKAAQKFMLDKRQEKVNIEHEEPIKGVCLYESWIVCDSAKDKTAFLGIDAPEGSWAGTFKVYDDNIWEEYVKSGEVKGFSIEGDFRYRRDAEAERSEMSADERLLREIMRVLESVS